jgi:serine protease Do
MQKRLMNLTGALILLGFGVFIGTAIQRLWFPAPEIATAAMAAAVSDSAAKGPSTGGLAAIPVSPRQTPVTRTVRQVSPSVVTVGAEKRQVVAQPWMDNYYFPMIRYKYFEQRARIPYMGSGFLVDREKGFVLTNYHVIEDSESIFVTFPDGQEYAAEVVDADKYVDISLLRIKDADLSKLPPALDLAEADDLMIGEQVMAIGNPFGNMIKDSRPTVTVGYISALHRNFRPDLENERVYADMIQTDAAINPGNSGGPLVNVNGEVVGVNTFIFSPTGASAGIGFAIPAMRLRTFLEEIRTYGRLRPLLLDFDFRTVRTRQFTGVQIVEVTAGGPAEGSGLQPGDLLLEADGRPVASREDFYLLFASKQVGERVRLKISRGNQELDIEYRVQEAPDPDLPKRRI